MSNVVLAAWLAVALVTADLETAGTRDLPECSGGLQTGSLIFSEGDCMAVKVFTKSDYTHVAAVAVDAGQPFVYDSAKGSGVRRQTLDAYLKSQTPGVVHFCHPRKPLTPREAERFAESLDAQLGRPYSIKHHLTGKRANGLHCAEYVTDALMACQLVDARRPPRVSPASLAQGVLEADLYAPPEARSLLQPKPEPAAGKNWCSRMWIRTRLCCANCCTKLSGWFLCR